MCLSPRSEALTENSAELHRPQVPGNMRQATSVGDTMSPHSQRLWQWLGLASCKHPFYLMGTSPLLTAPSPGLVIRNSRSCDRRLIPSILLTSTSNQFPNQFQSSEHTIVQVEQEAAHIFVINFPSSVCFILRNDLKGRRCRKKLFTPVRTRESQHLVPLQGVTVAKFSSLFRNVQ